MLDPVRNRTSLSDSGSASVEYQSAHIGGTDEKHGSVEFVDENGDPPEHTLKQGMEMRHIQMIALGGAIGTGLFVGSGAVLSMTGPGPLLLSYIVLSVVVWFVMNSLSEMATFLPVPGVGAQQFITDYLDPSFGFALGYNYYYCYAILVAAEVVAAALVIEYWTNSVHVAVFISILLGLLFVLNMCPVRIYGEAEFYFAGIKLITITGLIILGIVLFFGGGPNHDRLGFRYWKHGLAFKLYLVLGPTGRFFAVWTAIIKAGYSFIVSPELIVACSAEVTAPRKAIPRCASQFIYRLAFVYILSSFIIGVIADSTSKNLTEHTDTAYASPFVIGIQNAGIPVLNHIINAVVLTSATSAGNAFMYAASRTLFSLSKKGLAPKVFSRVNSYGVPYMAVLLTSAIGCLAYLYSSDSSIVVFFWLTSVTTISGFIAWIAVIFSYLRWRKAIEFRGIGDRVPYKTRFQPFGSYFVICFISLVTLTNGYAVFFHFDIANFLAAYITFPIVVVLYVGHRLYSVFILKRTRWLTPYEEFDFSKLEMVEYQETQYPVRIPKNRWEKICFAIF